MDEQKKYYYVDDGSQIGPLTMTELRLSNITRTTLVWFEGMDEWLPAGQVEEVAGLIKRAGPPPIPDRPVPPPIPGAAPKAQAKNRPAARPQARESSKPNRQVEVSVYKSDNYRATKAVMLFMAIFITSMGILLTIAGETSEKGLGVGMVVVGLLFGVIYVLVARSAREVYRIGLDHARGVLWVERPSLNKRFSEDWADQVQAFQMVEQSSSRRVRSGGMTTTAVKKSWDLQVSLSGREHWWPVPGSTFYSKADARAVVAAVQQLL